MSGWTHRAVQTFSLGLALFVGLTTGVAAAQTTGTSAPRLISVSGEGIIKVQPDMATLRFGVVTESDNAEEARRLNAEAAAQAMNAVRALGVPERKIQLEVLRLQPKQEYNEQTRRYVQVGFEAIRIVSVELDDVNKLPELVAQVVQQGANRLESISYDLKDRDAARDEALRQAVTKARDKAQLVASALGVELGPVHRVDEQGFNFPQPVYRMAEMAAADKVQSFEPEAYAAGEIEVRANVQAAFEIR